MKRNAYRWFYYKNGYSWKPLKGKWSVILMINV